MTAETTNTYTIYTTQFNKENNMVEFETTTDEKKATRTFFYLRHAYPNANTSLQMNGWIVGTAELAKLAGHLILDNHKSGL